jgi:3-deoxy-D-manno-octulosonate 8-phosphate phosphatase (KDO 8-P phosphatase)
MQAAPIFRLDRSELEARLRRVKLFLCDVDGILTDATVLIGGERELKVFNIRDGLGLRLLQKSGVKVGWISNRTSLASTARAEELKMDFLVQGSGSKVEAAEKIREQLGLAWHEISYAGDDVVDLKLLKKVGVAFAVSDGIEETKAIAHYVTAAGGGRGAVREMVDLLMKAQGTYQEMIRNYVA